MQKDFQRGEHTESLEILLMIAHTGASAAAVLTICAIAVRQCSTPFRYYYCSIKLAKCQDFGKGLLRFVAMHNFGFQNSIFCTILGFRVKGMAILLDFFSFFLSFIHIFIAENNAENRNQSCDNKYNYSKNIVSLRNAVAEYS